jgi:hypothetical protein
VVISAVGVGTGDITGVSAGTGLSGGGLTGDVTLRLDTGYVDGRFVNEAQANSVTAPMIQSNQVVKGVNNLKDNVQIKAGSNISVTTGGDSVVISATDEGGNTLDEAYDQGGAGAGRTITADAGAVNIEGSGGLTVSAAIGIGTSTPNALLHTVLNTFGDHLKLERIGAYPSFYAINLSGHLIHHVSAVPQLFEVDTATVMTITSTKVDINGVDGAMFGGTYGSGMIPASGAGTRMMWYPRKAAFRAGYVSGTHWNQDSIGTYSFAAGYNTKALGAYANAMGYTATAGGDYSLAVGRSTNATGLYSIAMGYNTSARSANATAIGYNSVASGGWSTAIGATNTASGQYSVALGGGTTASGLYSTAMGYSTTASGEYSTALGREIEASGDYTVAIALADLNGLQITQNNTMAVMGGNVGIGQASPLTKLHVKNADIALPAAALTNDLVLVENTDAALGLYSDNSGNYGSAFSMGEVVSGALTNKWSIYRTTSVANPANQLRFSFGTDANYSVNTTVLALSSNGNVGIGTTSPTTRLDVRGNVTIRDQSTGDVSVELGTGLDYAEGFDVADPTEITPGTVLCIDPEHPGKLKISERAYDTRVAGIVAGANNLGSGVSLGTGSHDCNVALAGRVYCNADATLEAIAPGDLLTTSDRPGFAKRVTDFEAAHGAILGKAMEGLAKGTRGQILVLVTLQ